MVSKKLELKLWEPNYETVLVNQGEVNSRFLEVSFKDKDEYISLSDKNVTFYAAKPDGTKIFNDCTVSGENKNAVLSLTSQMTSIEGVLECEFQIFGSEGSLLKAGGLQIIVSNKEDFSQAIESTSEFNVLTQAINAANEFSNSIGDISELTTNEKDSLIGAINEVNSKIIPISCGGTGATTAQGARENLELKKEYVLYENSSGTMGTITLQDSYTNYTNIKIYFYDHDISNAGELLTVRDTVCLSNSHSGQNQNDFYVQSCFLTFSGNTATISRNCSTIFYKEGGLYNNLGEGQGLYIIKIVGYK